ncbi:FAD-dependent oxidoreductase [Pseudonocardia sp.]|uniref:FAD-dependent oxidoreductase n=1 Tax=Pseudonocardia sp. TaxID=60912 RepID=UPI0031FE3F15
MSPTHAEVDVLIIGAGVVGAAIACRLSQLEATVAVIDRRHDIAEETSKSNSGITASGWSLPAGGLEARLVRASSPRWEDICGRLGVPFRRCGAVVVARTQQDAYLIPEMMRNAEANGVKVRALTAEQVLRAAPHATSNSTGGIEISAEGVIDSIRLTIGYGELAALNGVRFLFSEPLLDAINSAEEVVEVRTPGAVLRPRFVINAAGLGADAVSKILGCEDVQITARRGEWLLMDREFGRRVPRILTMMPTERTHGLMVIPTAHGTCLLGPTAEDLDNKHDRSTNSDVLRRILRECRTLMPDIDERYVIKSFSGLRHHSERTYRIEPSARMRNVIHVAGIRSTGVSASPGIADYVLTLLQMAGLEARPKTTAYESLDTPPPFSGTLDCEQAGAAPFGRTVVCPCEKVTAAEIHRAMSSALPARSISGVAKRTHATWGRCQGAACLSGVSFIASLYLGGQAWEVPYGEPGTTLGVARARHV